MSGSAPSAMNFCVAHPTLVMHATALSASAVGGQFFIYSMVKEFGALVFAASMNLRQVISILTSYWLSSHPIARLQAFALVIVFGTLFYKSYLGWSAGDKHGSRNEAEGGSVRKRCGCTLHF